MPLQVQQAEVSPMRKRLVLKDVSNLHFGGEYLVNTAVARVRRKETLKH